MTLITIIRAENCQFFTMNNSKSPTRMKINSYPQQERKGNFRSRQKQLITTFMISLFLKNIAYTMYIKFPSSSIFKPFSARFHSRLAPFMCYLCTCKTTPFTPFSHNKNNNARKITFICRKFRYKLCF